MKTKIPVLGAIDAEDVLVAMKGLHKNAMNVEQAQMIIERLDTDHDGKVKYREFVKGLYMLDAHTLQDFEVTPSATLITLIHLVNPSKP